MHVSPAAKLFRTRLKSFSSATGRNARAEPPDNRLFSGERMRAVLLKVVSEAIYTYSRESAQY